MKESGFCFNVIIDIPVDPNVIVFLVSDTKAIN